MRPFEITYKEKERRLQRKMNGMIKPSTHMLLNFFLNLNILICSLYPSYKVTLKAFTIFFMAYDMHALLLYKPVAKIFLAIVYPG